MKGYLISGLGPGTSGLGRFLNRISTVGEKHGWKVLCRPQSSKRVLFSHCLAMAWFYTHVKFIRNANVLILHPQTLRWRTFFRLVRTNRVNLYVADNSFFCIRSYNYRGQQWEECLDCLGDLSRCHPSCMPFPVFYDRKKNLSYLDKLKKAAPWINFLVQNPTQGHLVTRHFGPDTRVRVVGMMTDEFEGVKRGEPGSRQFDVVFHGALTAAKGAGYVIELARRLPELSFLLPGRSEDAGEQSVHGALPENVTVRDLTWETGLRGFVENCGIVLCPSLWSAPIEGALVKSLLHNGRVAVFDTMYGYQADLPENLVWRLGPDIETAARQIREGLQTSVNGDLVDEWIEKLIAETDLDSVFR